MNKLSWLLVANSYAREAREEVVKVEVKNELMNINELPRAKHVTLFVDIRFLLLTAFALAFAHFRIARTLLTSYLERR